MAMSLNVENYRSEMHKAVHQKGSDFVYKKPVQNGTVGVCVYVENRGTPEETPSCIHGHVLTALGYEIHEDREHKSIMHVLLEMGVTDEGLLVAAGASQAVQDEGKTWGQALDTFNKTVDAYYQLKRIRHHLAIDL